MTEPDTETSVSEMSTGKTPKPGVGSQQGASPTSSYIAIGGSVLVVVLFLWQVPEATIPTMLGSLGALSLTASLWILTHREDPSMQLLLSLLTLPIAIGFVGAGVVMSVALVGEIFPVADPSLLSLGSLLILGYIGVVLGCSIAILGVLVGSITGIDSNSLRQYSTIAFVTALVPGVVGILLAGSSLLVTDGSGDSLVTHVISITLLALLRPDPIHLNLASFLFVLAATAAAVKLAIATLPVRELISNSEGNQQTPRVDTFDSVLSGVAIVATSIAVIAFFLELTYEPTELEALLGNGVFNSVRFVASSTLLRSFLVVIASISLIATMTGQLLRRFSRLTSVPGKQRFIALTSGFAITVVGLAIAESVYATTVSEVGARLPEMITPTFTEQAAEIATIYGEATILVSVIAFLIGSTGMVLLGLRLLLSLGYLSRDATGFSIASIGLLIASIFGATIGVPNWTVFVGVTASFFVWDVGHFGITVWNETGYSTSSRSSELVHAAGTGLVGLVGIGLATVLTFGVSLNFVQESPATVIALLSFSIAIIALVEALRYI